MFLHKTLCRNGNYSIWSKIIVINKIHKFISQVVIVSYNLSIGIYDWLYDYVITWFTLWLDITVWLIWGVCLYHGILLYLIFFLFGGQWLLYCCLFLRKHNGSHWTGLCGAHLFCVSHIVGAWIMVPSLKIQGFTTFVI